MKGIYKITSPSGKIYIGQSIDIAHRFLLYKSVKCVNRQPLIERSFLKYGFKNHIFSIVCELPNDIDKYTLSRYEQVYMDQYRECGFLMLNISAASDSPYGCKRSEAQKKKHSEFMKGRPSARKGVKLTQEQKDHLRKINTGKPFSEVARRKLKSKTPWNKGLTGISCGPKGIKVSEATKEKLRLANLGKKLSEESLKKREETRRANGNNKGWCDEARKRRSDLYKARGFKASDETKAKISEGGKLAWIRRKS